MFDMSQYFIKGNRVEVIADGAINLERSLAPHTYFVKYEQTLSYTGFYLEKGDNFTPISRMYGDIDKKTKMVINTYLDRLSKNINTGVLLSGLKGSGKTLQAKSIANELRVKYEIPTIIISNTYNTSLLSLYLKDISDPAVIIFEEFEKLYKSSGSESEYENSRMSTHDSQEGLLTLLDGVMNSNKLFLFTCNDTKHINELLLNRPGRVWYHFSYKGLDESVVEEYCCELLNDEESINQVKLLCDYLDDGFTFDIMQCIVEECIRCKAKPLDIIQHMNIKPEPYNSFYSVSVNSCNNKDSVTISNSYNIVEISNYLSEKKDINIKVLFSVKNEADVKRINEILQNEVDTNELIVPDNILSTDTGNPIGFNSNEKKYPTFSVRITLNRNDLVKSSRNQLTYRKHDLEFIMTKIRKENFWSNLII